jgi:hypothetical protein
MTFEFIGTANAHNVYINFIEAAVMEEAFMAIWFLIRKF